jgi:hypothetical protein
MAASASKIFQPSTILIAGMIVFAALSRLIPHPPNFSPIEAMALFGGAYFAQRSLALLVPLIAMLLSDLIIGLHSGLPVVYACMTAITVMGFALRKKSSLIRIASFGFAGASLFFVVTNFMVWAGSGMYPMTAEGLVACYVAAIPFFANQLAGVAFYSAVLFGGYALLRQRFPQLNSPQAA